MILATLEEGLRHHQAGRLDSAEELYRRVLSNDPRQPDALHLLGMAAFVRGRREEGHDLVRRAIQAKPNEAVFYANLGIVLESLERWADAEAAYRHALALNPRNAPAFNCLGNLHRAAWRLDEAARCYQAALALDAQFPAAQSNLGNTFADQSDFDRAIACYRRTLEIDPNFVDARKNLANSLMEQGRYREAADELGQAQALRPEDATLKIRAALLLPAIPESAAWIDERRRTLSDDLDALMKQDLHVDDPVSATLGPAFYLAYHGRDDLQFQTKIAAMYARAVPSLAFTAPHCRRRRRNSQSPIRVGLISRFFHNHSVGDHYAGLVRSFPRANSRYTVFRFPGANDAVSQGIEAAADEVVILPPRINEAREQIAGRELDVLLYTDIGMDPWTYFLAFARLATVQCVTLGHPVTTGIPTVDYFLSCDRQEPADASAHYRERLVRFANKPHYFSPPEVQQHKRREDFSVPADLRWYVCHQTLFKIHPDFDRLAGEILRRDPHGCVVLFEGQQTQWTRLLQARLQHSIPDVADRIIFLPRQSYQEYLAFLQLADVLLDTVHFGAGTTTYHAIGLGVPLVTLPGAFSRGRGTDAAYRRMDVSDCVATDEQDYVRRAVAIANDRSLRNAIGQTLRERMGVLFSNTGGAEEIESFFVDAVRRAEAGTT